MKKNKEQMLTSVTCSHRNVGFGHLTSILTREEPIFSADPNGGREVNSPPITNQNRRSKTHRATSSATEKFRPGLSSYCSPSA